MALSSYSTIKTAIGDWLGRSDLGDPIDDMIDNVEVGGAATYMESAINADINLFI